MVKVLLDHNRSDKVLQSQLMAAIEPVAQRLMTLFKEAQLAYRQAEDFNDKDALKRAKDELDALMLFRSDMGTYGRFYTFLSQIFDYNNTGLEKRAMFYKALLPLLEFEREVNTIDLSKVVLTHHHLRDLGTRKLDLTQGDSIPIPGMAPVVVACRTRTRWSWPRSSPSSMRSSAVSSATATSFLMSAP